MRSPAGATRRSSPPRATHPAGTFCFLNPRHPFVVEPSNRSFHPAAFSAGVSTFMSSDETVSVGTDAVALAVLLRPDEAQASAIPVTLTTAAERSTRTGRDTLDFGMIVCTTTLLG